MVEQITVANALYSSAKDARACGALQIAEQTTNYFVTACIIKVDSDVADRAVREVCNLFACAG
ncbi:MAG: hypothetical protein ACJAVT_001215 [Yoonia sp.]|jgi:hypothetical protein